jgi:phage terminase small subunit
MSKGNDSKPALGNMADKLKFALAYWETGVVWSAAKNAGVSKSTAYRWMQEDDVVKSEIQRLREFHQKEAQIDKAAFVQMLLSQLGVTVKDLMNDDGSLKPISEMDSLTASKIQSISVMEHARESEFEGKDVKRSVSVKLANNEKIMQMLGQVLGLFVNKVEVTDTTERAQALLAAQKRALVEEADDTQDDGD